MERAEVTIVGAGVIGLAVAAELAKDHKDIFVLEKNDSFGEETSSRNSEVIHAGIYYPKDSLKARTCVEGKRLLYEYCLENKIPHKKTGKLIVAVNKDETGDLEALLKKASANGVSDLKLLSGSDVKGLEPNVKAKAAVYSPSTGILDSHAFMKSLASRFRTAAGEIICGAEVVGVKRAKGGFEVAVKDKREEFAFFTRIFINSAGLNSDKVAGMAGFKQDEYRLKYCKGDYFRVSGNKARLVNRLVYPVPKVEGAGLGIHATADLTGGLRLGPDDEYISEIDYKIDESKAASFHESVRSFLPFVELKDLSPDTSGIRPKLQGPGEAFRDFVIKEESDKGLEGFINLIGIESPGLTGALSIAGMVKRMVRR